MTPRSLTLALTLLAAIPAVAQNQNQCSLGMTMNCTNGVCTAVTTNTGSNMCTGEYVVAILIDDPQSRGTVTGFSTTLGLSGQECFDSSTFPIGFGFGGCIGNASLGPGNSFTMHGTVNLAGADPSTIVAITEVLDPVTEDEIGLAYVFNSAAPTPTCTPQASVPQVTQSGVAYNVTWTAVTEPSATYTIDESTAADFSANLVSKTTSTLSSTFQHTGSTTTTYYYRVRANVCSGAPGPNSPTVAIVVQAIPTVTGRQGDATAPLGSTTPVSMNVFIPSPSGKQALDVTVPFTASVDKSYLTVTPSSGTIPPGGTTVTVTANPSSLPPGANTGTLTVTSNGAPVTTKSVSVSLVTPVAPSTTGLPPANAIIIPAVAHLQGAFGPFQSDVRLTNASSAMTSYQIKFTSGGSDPSRPIKTTTLNVDAGQTIALNVVLKDFFGVAAADPSNGGGGVLEIRPLNTTSPLNYGSSRLFTFDAGGNTFGQFIAAIPFTQFATNASIVSIPGVPAPTGTPTLSLQQVATSAKFRTNLGLVEGSGSSASGNIKLYNDAGQLLATVPYSLSAGEQKQSSLPGWGFPNVDDGRIEVTVESTTGAVTAYASVLDNNTQDPLEVTPVQVSQVSSTRYVLPGMALLIRSDTNFHSDIRIYNGGSSAATVNATFYPQDNGTPVSVPAFSIGAGQVKAYDDVIASLFSLTSGGGSIVFTTSAASSLVATGRTYTIDSTKNNGTFGQFIPGVTPTEGIGAGDRPLQILQLEESTNFRSNLGLAELSGNPVTVHVTGYLPDSKFTAATDVTLGANQFTQLGHVFVGLFPGQNVYNGRISIAVTGGTGRVAAYGSVIDNLSTDATYVPSQK